MCVFVCVFLFVCVCVFVSKERKEELTQAKNTIMISGFADTGTAMGSGGQPFKFRALSIYLLYFLVDTLFPLLQ